MPPRCEFEGFFSITDPTATSRQNLTIYPRVLELVDASADRASLLARESRALHRVVPLKRKMFYVGDQPDYCAARFLIPVFSRISKNKNILKTRASSVTLADLEKLDRGSELFLRAIRSAFGCCLRCWRSLKMRVIIRRIQLCSMRAFRRCRLRWPRKQQWRLAFLIFITSKR